MSEVDLENPETALVGLAQKAQTLDLEIIDFLLSWEENRSSGNSSREGVIALERVDQELAQVDKWISEQMDRLQATKLRLNIIDIESNLLETTWSNLATIKDTLEYSIDRLTLSESQVKIIAQPNVVLDSIIKSNNPSKSCKALLTPLLAACDRLSRALTSVPDDQGTSKLAQTTSTFSQVSSLSAFSLQRETLARLSNNLCKTLHDKLPSFFLGLLDHPSLTDLAINNEHARIKAITSKNSANFGVQCSVESFSDSDWDGLGSSRQAAYDLVLKNYELIAILDTDADATHWMNEQRVCQELVRGPILQDLLGRFHEFQPRLYDSFLDVFLSDIWKTRLYTPLLKSLCKSFKAALAPRSAVCTLNSIAGFSLSRRTALPIHQFSKADELTPQLAFACLLSTLVQLIRAEEAFLKVGVCSTYSHALFHSYHIYLVACRSCCSSASLDKANR